MKHLAVRATSMHNPRPFTATGLGDRIHCCTVAWCYGTPVTLHLTEYHQHGGQFGNKLASWREVCRLFPPGAITLAFHLTRPLSEQDWMKEAGAPVWCYGDYPTSSDPACAVDVTPMLRRVPWLVAEPVDVALPDKFFTVQWDANGNRRTAPARAREAIVERYLRAGLEPVVLGGEAADPFRWSLRAAAYALSRAEYHVGADSAFMHLAMLYLPPERVHVYTQELTHHTRRARANGSEVTLC